MTIREPPVISWDRIRIRPPICYFPPVWELILNKEVGQFAQELAESNPDPAPWAIEKHLKQRIETVNKLVAAKKLDAGLGRIATSHFQAHLQELEALRAQK